MHQEYDRCSVQKTLVVEDELTERTFVKRIYITQSDQHLIFGDALKQTVPDLQGKIIRVYDYSRQIYAVVNNECKVPLTWLNNNNCEVLLIKMGEIIQTSASNRSSASHEGEARSESSSVKKQRSKQRVIFQVIEIVKRWRELHLSRNNIKKVSLQQAAKLVGLPKKSLDDYYYQLRLGQKYSFDFQHHLFDRIGVLRTYLKNLKDHSGFDKHQKHPKKLRIIDQFDSLSELFYRQQGNQDQDEALPMQQQMEGDNLLGGEEQQQRSPEAHYDQVNHFKSEFQYLLDEKDPFLAGDYNFKKKHIEESNSQEIFF